MARYWLDETGSKWLVFLADSLEAMKLIPDGTIDLIITDPPYESLEKHRDSDRIIREYEKRKAEGTLKGTRIPRLRNWFEIMPNEMFPEFLFQCHRIMADNSHLYIFCDDETSDVIYRCNEELEQPFKWWKRIVWDKEVRGQGYHYPNQHEFVVFLEKGKRKLNTHDYTSVIRHKRVSKTSLGGRDPYPTEKPVGVVEKFILNSSNPEDLVFDPFCGSGAVGAAALMNNREFFGFDLSRRAVRISRCRLRFIENEI